MVWKLIAAFVALLLLVLLLAGPTIAEATAAGLCELLGSSGC